MNRPSKFSFIDESEAVRRLDVDRDTLLSFVREKRLKAYPGVGKGNFYRLSEVDALASELRAQGRTLTGIAVLVGLNVPQSAHQAIRRCREQQTGQAPRVQRLAY